jgi:hypothetical protein
MLKGGNRISSICCKSLMSLVIRSSFQKAAIALSLKTIAITIATLQ